MYYHQGIQQIFPLFICWLYRKQIGKTAYGYELSPAASTILTDEVVSPAGQRCTGAGAALRLSQLSYISGFILDIAYGMSSFAKRVHVTIVIDSGLKDRQHLLAFPPRPTGQLRITFFTLISSQAYRER